jgi:hypothetical protein
MKRTLIAVAALAVLVAACGGSGSDRVASLEDTNLPASDGSGGGDESFEETVLAFSACMRENGVEDFVDPDFNADGSLNFTGEFRQNGAAQETLRAAFEACQSHLEGIAFGRGAVDFTEIEDRLVEFASCMRDNGYDMPDPDFSNFGRGGGGGPFGEDLDPDDPGFQEALGACEDIFEGFRIGGGPGGGPGRGG